MGKFEVPLGRKSASNKHRKRDRWLVRLIATPSGIGPPLRDIAAAHPQLQKHSTSLGAATYQNYGRVKSPPQYMTSTGFFEFALNIIMLLAT